MDLFNNITKFYPISYNEPAKKDMAIIMVYFNTTKSVRIAQHILLVKQYLDKAKIPYYIGELSIDGSPYLFEESSNIFHYKTDDYMFYKENLINLVEARIPDEYTKICNIDADIFFSNPDWYNMVSNILESVNVCQPFNIANWLNIENNNCILTRQNCFIDKHNGHPGFAWAFTRQFFKLCRLPDFCVTGSGDLCFYRLIVNNVGLTDQYFKYLVPSMNNYIKSFNVLAKNSNTFITFGYVNQYVYHLYHGSLRNRKYDDRHEDIIDRLKQFNVISIEDMIDYDSNGIRCWKPPYKEEMNKHIKKYLCGRNDDGI